MQDVVVNALQGNTRRLCIVTPAHATAFMGGAQYQVKCLLDAVLPLHRFDIRYVTRRAPLDFNPVGYELVQLGTSARVPRLGYWVDAWRLYRALRRFAPDVIYQRVACAYTGVAAFYARRHGTRMIWHVAHENDVTPGGGPSGKASPFRWLERRFVDYGIRHATRVVTQTRDQALLLRENFGRDADAVVPNFHPLPDENLGKSELLTVVWVANLKPWKRPEAFVSLARALAPDLTNVRFVMVGAPPQGEGDRAWGARLLHEIGSTPNLQYLGHRSQAEVNSILARAHLFVNTSRREGFANTFIQAWMRRVPVVSLHVNPDGVLDGEEVGIHAGSEDALVAAVRTLLTDTARREAMGERARDYALTRHSVLNAEKLIALFE
jgi:glycosyltransferase involved in cell wall biosynthesis